MVVAQLGQPGALAPRNTSTCSASQWRADSASDTSRKALWMAFVAGHGLVAALSARSSAAERRPASKIGRLSFGAKLQARLPLSNRPSSSALAVP